MDITLPPQLAKFVTEKVKEGRYGNASEVIHDALRKFEMPKTSMLGEDIEAMAFLVMMEAAKSAQEDVKAIMAEVKAINAAKSAMRGLLTKVARDAATNAGRTDRQGPLDLSRGLGSEANYHKALIPVANVEANGGVEYFERDLWPGKLTSVDQLNGVVDKVKSDIDSMSEMGEMESLRLQMAMDRMSKMMSTLSNILKKISDTASAIVNNFK